MNSTGAFHASEGFALRNEGGHAAVHSHGITSEDGRTEAWPYREGAWRQKRQ